MTRALCCALVLISVRASASGQCTPFDSKDGGVVNGRLADGGQGPDQSMCCKEGVDCNSECPFCVGKPVDAIRGFAWVDRVDVNLNQPWGPPVRFARHYGTANAERGATSPLGLGWSHTYSSFLTLFGPNPASRVWLFNGEATGEEFNLSGGSYVSMHGGRALTWDSTTQMVTVQAPG